MRGRAIRVMKEQPEKTSNIWHLVCLRPWNEVLKADDNQISDDYSMLERRMEHFLGLHYSENTIENGIKRLSIIKTPFNKTSVDRINRQMLKMSGQRDALKERWNSALAIYDKMDIVDETEVKDKFVTSVVFWDAILTMILLGILCLIGMIGAGIEGLRLYVEGYNLLTFSGLTKYNIDPESPAVNNGYYPQQRTYTLGVKLTF